MQAVCWLQPVQEQAGSQSALGPACLHVRVLNCVPGPACWQSHCSTQIPPCCPPSCCCRGTLEALSWNASCTSCRPDRTQYEVVPHLRLELTNPKQTIFLYGNVTPLECAAAHGHVDAMKLLMQVSALKGLAGRLVKVGDSTAQGCCAQAARTAALKGSRAQRCVHCGHAAGKCKPFSC